MKRLIIVGQYLLLFSSLSFSQHPVEVKYERDFQNNYVFSCFNHAFCDYSVEVSFTELQNLSANVSLPFKAVVKPGYNSLFRLTLRDMGIRANFSYNYRYLKGSMNAKVNLDYAYLLPVAPRKDTRIVELDYLMKRYGNESEPKDWYAIGLKMNSGDTVYAARRGVVCSVKDNANLKDSGYSFSSQDNFIEIYHVDGSFALYQVFRDKGIFVKLGQLVEAGQPIGVVGGDNYELGPHVRFCVYYSLEQDVFRNSMKTDRKNYWAYVPLHFWTKEKGKLRLMNHNQYISEHPESLITQEMSKRELKKRTGKHKT